MFAALGGSKTMARVRGLHFGGAIAKSEPTGNALAGKVITDWLAD